MGYRKVLRDRDQALLGTGSSWSSICQGRRPLSNMSVYPRELLCGTWSAANTESRALGAKSFKVTSAD